MTAAYVDPLEDPLRPLTAADISTIIFKKTPTWFDRHCNRKKLYQKGFPHPFERGRWSVQGVKARPQRGRRDNAYAPISH